MNMNRREFLSFAGAAATVSWRQHAEAVAVSPASGDAAGAHAYRNLLVLVELKGGNDGLNTLIPYADARYYQLRPTIGIPRHKVIPLDERTGLHPSLADLMPLWQDRSLAIVQGVGYPKPNLSHYRSIEIWDTASHADQYLRTGWLTRAFASEPVRARFAADGVVIGSAEIGPLANGARTVALTNPVCPYRFGTTFPQSAFGSAVRKAMQVVASGGTARGVPVAGQGVAVVRLTLNGFDTHENQPVQHANLLKQFAQGMTAMRSALGELNRWHSTLVMTYAEFGRRARENASNGTGPGETRWKRQPAGGHRFSIGVCDGARPVVEARRGARAQWAFRSIARVAGVTV
jgi:uncharacterized protein (DUF1501 family)